MLEFNQKQLEKLSELFMAGAKGLFLISFTLPLVTKYDFIIFSIGIVYAILLTYTSLVLLQIKKKRKK